VFLGVHSAARRLGVCLTGSAAMRLPRRLAG